jgi:hypothetical protein
MSRSISDIEKEMLDRIKQRAEKASLSGQEATIANLRDAIVEARRRLAKGRALWNGPCIECDAVLEQALNMKAPTDGQ